MEISSETFLKWYELLENVSFVISEPNIDKSTTKPLLDPPIRPLRNKIQSQPSLIVDKDTDHKMERLMQTFFRSSRDKEQLYFGNLFDEGWSSIHVTFPLPDGTNDIAYKESLIHRYKTFYVWYMQLETSIDDDDSRDIVVKTYCDYHKFQAIPRHSVYGLYLCFNVVFHFFGNVYEKLKRMIDDTPYDNLYMQVELGGVYPEKVYYLQSYVPHTKILKHMRRDEIQPYFDQYFNHLQFLIFLGNVPKKFENLPNQVVENFLETGSDATAVTMSKENILLDKLVEDQNYYERFLSMFQGSRIVPLFHLIPIDLLFENLKPNIIKRQIAFYNQPTSTTTDEIENQDLILYTEKLTLTKCAEK